MSMDLMTKAFKIKVGSHLRKLILIKLADNASDQGECWPSYGHIAAQCECSKSAVREHIVALVGMGLVEKENRLGRNNGKGNTSNIYRLKLNTPVSPESRPPMPAGDTACTAEKYPLYQHVTPPVSPESRPPMPAGGTRISHSFEPINEPVIEPLKTIGAQAGASTPAKPAKAEYSSEFETAWKAYPARQGSNPKNKAYQAWNARLRDGVTTESMLEGVKRYAAYQLATGKAGTEFVMQGARFFGPGLEFENAWVVTGVPQPKPQDNKHSGFSDRDYGTTHTPAWARGNA
ncbi:helix-turn-helix domain-containing protein [Buttiauxella noackiae]|uniref:helix-turn-helix domain-containing protein n=1 Tax=Buttiauxella noackiae TaxID=82992 RepID=UPI0028D7DE55|nr:helix-turn-helix domain-containing protein [Buttiauxella noackiae]